MSIERISNKMFSDTLLAHLRDHSRELNDLHYKLSSGKRVRYPSDDPIATIDVMRQKTYIAQNEQYIRNIDDGLNWLKTTEQTLDNMKGLLERAKVLAIQGGSETFNENDREKIADEVNELLETAVDVANANIKFGDRYLLAGTDVLTMPFQVQRDPDTGEITSVTYHGDRNEIFRDIDRGVRISINTIGDEVFSLDRLKVIDEATGTLKHTRHNLVMGSTLVDDPDRPLGDIYSGTYPGVFRINGVEIFYDADDTLNDIKDKINESGCNIYASYVFSEGSYKLSLRTNEAEEFWLEDLGDGELLQDLGLISPPPDEPPRNIDTSATEEKITLFQALIDLRDDLRADRTDRVRGRDLGNIDKCLENLLVHRSKIGAKMNRLERMREKHVDMNVFAKEILNEAESADMEDVIMNLAIQQTIQRAALASGARLIRPTLMDFLG